MNILELLKNDEKHLVQYLHLPEDTVLFREDDRCESIGIVITGEVSIRSYLPDGSIVTYNTLKDDEIFGNNLVFSSEPFYKGDIIAQKDTDAALIRKEDLLYLLTHNEAFLLEYMRIQSNFGKSLNNRIRLLSMSSAEERFFFHLHENHNQLTFRSISDLAGILYLERETLSRLLSRLEKEHKIIRSGKTIKLYNSSNKEV